MGDFVEVLLFASHCGDDTKGCSDARPCATCIGLSNKFRIPREAIVLENCLGSFSADWNSPDHVVLPDGFKAEKPGRLASRPSQDPGGRDGQ